MVTKRRMGPADSKVRDDLIEATISIIQTRGCAHVTARNVGEAIGLKGAIVHYYFESIDDLFVAALESSSAAIRDRITAALNDTSSLQAIWSFGTTGGPYVLELTALGIRRPKIGAAIRALIEEFRQLFTLAMEKDLQRLGILIEVPPVVITLLIQSLTQTMAVDRALDISAGHEEVSSTLKTWLSIFARAAEIDTEVSVDRSMPP